jgi:hypothetical protein
VATPVIVKLVKVIALNAVATVIPTVEGVSFAVHVTEVTAVV